MSVPRSASKGSQKQRIEWGRRLTASRPLLRSIAKRQQACSECSPCGQQLYQIALENVGKKEGEAQIISGNIRYDFVVVKQLMADSFWGIQNAIKNYMGLNIKMIRGRPTILGELLRAEDWKRIASLARENEYEYLFQAKLEESIKASITETLKQSYNRFRPFYDAL